MNHFLMDCQMKLWTIHVPIGVPEAIGLNVPNFIKDVPRVPKCVSRWGSTTNHFLMGSQMKFLAVADKMGVPKSIERDVPNFIKDVPNFVNDVPNFVNDVSRVPKYVSRWGSAMNHFLLGFQMKLWPPSDKMGVS